MSKLTLTLNAEQIDTIYNALLEDATRQDMRADDMADEIENVDCSYWIGQLVEAKLKQRNANNVRSFIREAIRESDDFNWSYTDSSTDKIGDDIKNAIRAGSKAV